MNARATEERRHALAAAGVIGGLLLVVLGGRILHAFAASPSEHQCRQLVDRYLEHAARQKNPALDDRELALALDQAKDAPSHGVDVLACTRALSLAQVECALASPNADELERCVQWSGP